MGEEINPNALQVLAFTQQLPSDGVTLLSSHFAKSIIRKNAAEMQ